jgi:DNA-3-methyladenine glycosylase I
MHDKPSCLWPDSDPQMIDYHDKEWGIPLHDDNKLFEFMVLDAFQAGLNWKIILHKRAAFEKAFSGFDPMKVARFDSRKIERLLGNPGTIRNRMKIEATVKNARALLKVQDEFGNFDDYIWRFTGGGMKVNRWKSCSQIPATSKESDAMSKDLKVRGFTFVGSTICYAFMQAAGMVNDHLVTCFRYREVMKAD